MSKEYFDINRRLWNEKTEIHLKSNFYEMDAFLKGKNTLKPIEMKLLEDIKGKSILHLQCHFGQDSLSLSRLGAKVTGLDISDKSIETARKLNDQLGLDAHFVCSDLFSAKEHIDEKFDIVFTTYGTIGWLPDMNKWADVISHFMKPGGKFIFVELHPLIWMYDDKFEQILFSYFNKEARVEVSPGTYANQEADIHLEEVGWNHPLSEVITALMSKKLKLMHFEEFNYSPHKCFKGMTEISDGQFIIKSIGNKVPMTYSLVMKF